MTELIAPKAAPEHSAHTQGTGGLMVGLDMTLCWFEFYYTFFSKREGLLFGKNLK